MKTYIILGIVVILSAVGAIYYFSQEESEVGARAVPKSAVDEFAAALEGRVISEMGQPIEGFEPSMFIAVYPGLRGEDFNNVKALIGQYVYVNGKLTHDLMGQPETHSAARAIAPEGMNTVLVNVTKRLGIDFETGTTVQDVLRVLDTPTSTNEGGSSRTGTSTSSGPSSVGITLDGTIVCLPHKDRTGPQTLECAIGLQTVTGQYYGLKNFNFGEGGLDTGVKARIQGTMSAPDAKNIYDIIGVLDVVSAKKL